MSLLLCTHCETDWELCGCPADRRSTVPVNTVLGESKRLRTAATKLKAALAEHDATCGRLLACCRLDSIASEVVRAMEGQG